MKKPIATIAVLIYFAFASGVVMNFHYCMGKYDSLRFYTASSDYCTKCGMHTKKHGCCHDEVKIVKLQDDHQVSSATFIFKNIQPAIVMLPEFVADDLHGNNQLSDYLNHSPPLLRGPGIYIKNRVFRI